LLYVGATAFVDVLPQPAAVAPDHQPGAVVQQPIEDRRGDHLIVKHLDPFLHRAISWKNRCPAWVSSGPNAKLSSVRTIRKRAMVIPIGSRRRKGDGPGARPPELMPDDPFAPKAEEEATGIS
jgi:hypothetical protein